MCDIASDTFPFGILTTITRNASAIVICIPETVTNALYHETRGIPMVRITTTFCMRMFEDASNEIADGPKVMDIVELIADGLPQAQAKPESAGD